MEFAHVDSKENVDLEEIAGDQIDFEAAREKRREQIRERAVAQGRDPEKALAGYDKTYNGEQNFYDNTGRAQRNRNGSR